MGCWMIQGQIWKLGNCLRDLKMLQPNYFGLRNPIKEAETS